MANKDRKDNKPKELSNYDKMNICQKAYDYMFTNPPEDDSKKVHFICVGIEKFLPETHIKMKAYEAIPELLEFKPAYRDDHNHWWSVNEDGMKIRKDVLHELIHRFRLSED